MRRVIASAAALVLFAGCGSSRSPAAPSVLRYTLSGNISSGNVGLPGATVLVVDGPDAGRSVLAGTAGDYKISGLQRAGFTVRVSLTGYGTESRGVTLTSDMMLNVQLTKVPLAVLAAVGALQNQLQADGSWGFVGDGENTGDGCAGQIAGTTIFSDANSVRVASLAWSMPSNVIVQPGQHFTYALCCLSQTQATAAKTYTTGFTFVTVACP